MQEQARFAVVNRYNEEQIRDNIFKIAQELDIPVKRDAIKVFNTNAVVKMSMDYTVPVDLFFYHTELHFSAASENKSLFCDIVIAGIVAAATPFRCLVGNPSSRTSS